MLPIINNKTAIVFNDTMNEFEPFFDDFISENKNSKTSVFIAISVALRIAAKLCRKFQTNKEEFIDAAEVNFDLENYN